MKGLTKDHFIASQMMVIAGLVKHLKDDLDDTVFEDEDALDSLLDTLSQGCNIAVSRMKQVIKESEDDDCDCD